MKQLTNGTVYFNKKDSSKVFNIISFSWTGPKYEQKAQTTTTTKTKKGGLGRALVGGAIAGPAGAVVGGVTGKSKGRSTSTTSFT